MTLKVYQVTLKTISPLFIGSGKKIGKKDYIVIDANHLGIIDEYKLYHKISSMGLSDDFEKDLLNGKYSDINTWAPQKQISSTEFKDCIRYELTDADLQFTGGEFKQMEIVEFMKDPYGLPYVPGSSLKGMFRTVLLANDIIKNPNKYSNLAKELEYDIYNSKEKRTRYLLRNIKSIEQRYFNILNKDTKKIFNAVNDFMQGVIISDSEPLKLTDLTLCQKMDIFPDEDYNKLNILRESIKPGVDINFTITIDTTNCSLTDKDFLSAIKTFNDCYNKYFVSKFDGASPIHADTVICGGASGFVSKTIIYPILKEKGLMATVDIFKKTGVPIKHRHDEDEEFEVSPHMLKCTKHKNKTYQMGLATIKFKEMIN